MFTPRKLKNQLLWSGTYLCKFGLHVHGLTVNACSWYVPTLPPTSHLWSPIQPSSSSKDQYVYKFVYHTRITLVFKQEFCLLALLSLQAVSHLVQVLTVRSSRARSRIGYTQFLCNDDALMLLSEEAKFTKFEFDLMLSLINPDVNLMHAILQHCYLIHA